MDLSKPAVSPTSLITLGWSNSFIHAASLRKSSISGREQMETGRGRGEREGERERGTGGRRERDRERERERERERGETMYSNLGAPGSDKSTHSS